MAAPKKRGRGTKKSAGIKLLKSGSTFIPVICRNCEDAPCVTACMSGGRYRDGKGRVVTDYRRCVGCWMCIMSCPFGAIDREEGAHVALKCDGCTDKDVPPCAEACERGVLSSRDIRSLSRDQRERAAARFLTGKNGGTSGR